MDRANARPLMCYAMCLLPPLPPRRRPSHTLQPHPFQPCHTPAASAAALPFQPAIPKTSMAIGDVSIPTTQTPLTVTPWCYCSRYSTSTVAPTVFIQWWLQYKPNSMKRVFFYKLSWIILSQFESLNFRTLVKCGPLSSVYNFL
jgi:hypothetical protein